MPIRRNQVFDTPISFEALGQRLSPSFVSVVGLLARPVLIAQTSNFDDDPLPAPEPNPIPYPGDSPPIVYPLLPPSGPAGPGS